jgi:hypothetical protein
MTTCKWLPHWQSTYKKPSFKFGDFEGKDKSDRLVTGSNK